MVGFTSGMAGSRAERTKGGLVTGENVKLAMGKRSAEDGGFTLVSIRSGSISHSRIVTHVL